MNHYWMIFTQLARSPNILQLLKLPDGTIKVLVEGIKGEGRKIFGWHKVLFIRDFVSEKRPIYLKVKIRVYQGL